METLSLANNSTTDTSHSPPPPSYPPPIFSTVRPAAESEISKILFNCPNKLSDSDPIPTWLLKKCPSVLNPVITNIVNFPLSSGNFHLNTLKESVISPLFKKSSLDEVELSNYHTSTVMIFPL